jgi:small ligand-binding sensory domain FIST
MPVRSVSVGLSEELDSLDAATEAAERARAGLHGECDLCLAFATGEHLPAFERQLGEVAERLSPRSLIGCGAGGTLASGRELERGPGMVVWAASLPGAEVATIRFPDEQVDQTAPVPLSPNLDSELADRTMILVADPYRCAIEPRLAEVAARYPGMPVLGGLASAALQDRSTVVVLEDGRLRGGGAAAALISGVQVLPCVSQGAAPVGPEMTITAAETNVIGELASKPAMERLGEVIAALPEPERELAANGVLLGIVIDENRPEHLRGDFLVRPIAGADRETGAIALGERVRVGQTVRLHVRDSASADEDLRAALRDQAHALGSEGAAGALLFTCNGRGSHMFDVPDHDAAAIEDALAAPAAGFFCAGEIGPVGGRNFLHGFTATMAVFPAS